jgi:replicative DNA helicase
MTPPGRRAYEPKFTSGEELFQRWCDDVNNGTGPEVYPHSLRAPVISPGNIMLIGGAPAAGKTALVMQVVVEALRHTDHVRALVANVEMSPEALLDRQLARLCGIEAEVIRRRQFDDRHRKRLPTGIKPIREIIDRLAFLEPPFSLDNVANAADRHHANIVVLDYVQRIVPPGQAEDGRARVNDTMSVLRKFAASGVAIIAVSALGRGRDKQGRSSYDAESMGLASFRESSELEYGADDAYILAPTGDADPNRVRLLHLKSRHGAQETLDLSFDRARQLFLIAEPTEDRRLAGGSRGPRAVTRERLAAKRESAPSALGPDTVIEGDA